MRDIQKTAARETKEVEANTESQISDTLSVKCAEVQLYITFSLPSSAISVKLSKENRELMEVDCLMGNEVGDKDTPASQKRITTSFTV